MILMRALVRRTAGNGMPSRFALRAARALSFLALDDMVSKWLKPLLA